MMDINNIGNFKNFLNENLSTNVSLTKRNGPVDYLEEFEESLRLDCLTISDIEMGVKEGQYNQGQFSIAEQKWQVLEKSILDYVKYVQNLEEKASARVPQSTPKKESENTPEKNEYMDFWDRYEEVKDTYERIVMLEDEIGGIESDLEYLYRTTEQNNRRENAVKIAELEEELRHLSWELNHITR